MSRPEFCPNCGVKLPPGAHGAQPFSRARDLVALPLSESTVPTPIEIEGGWDCYCALCEWSGDILPDEETP